MAILIQTNCRNRQNSSNQAPASRQKSRQSGGMQVVAGGDKKPAHVSRISVKRINVLNIQLTVIAMSATPNHETCHARGSGHPALGWNRRRPWPLLQKSGNPPGSCEKIGVRTRSRAWTPEMRLVTTRDATRLTGLSTEQLREWTSRRALIPPDVKPKGHGAPARYSWQTILLLRLAVTLRDRFKLELQAHRDLFSELGLGLGRAS